MKRIFTIATFIFSFFAAFYVSFGQPSIVALKSKLQLTENSNEKSLIVDSLVQYYLVQQELDSFIKYGAIAIPLHESVGKKDLALRTSLSLSLLFVSKGDIKAGERYMPADENYFANKKDYIRQARFDFNKATILGTQNNSTAAQQYYNKILDSYNKGYEVEHQMVFRTYESLFGNYVYTQQYSKALKTSNNYTNFIEKHYPEHIGFAYYYLGGLYRFTSDYKKANEQFLKSLRFYESKKDALSVAASHMQLGTNYLSLKQIDSSISHLEKAQAYYKSVDDKESIARTYNALSASYFEMKTYQKRKNIYKRRLR